MQRAPRVKKQVLAGLSTKEKLKLYELLKKECGCASQVETQEHILKYLSNCVSSSALCRYIYLRVTSKELGQEQEDFAAVQVLIPQFKEFLRAASPPQEYAHTSQVKKQEEGEQFSQGLSNNSLLSKLTQLEVIRLFQAFKKKYDPHLPDLFSVQEIRQFFRSEAMPMNDFYRFIYWAFCNNESYQGWDENPETILARIETVREILQHVPLPQAVIFDNSCMKNEVHIPLVTAWNERVGRVRVSKTALQHFCWEYKRWLKAKQEHSSVVASDNIVLRLQESFRRAERYMMPIQKRLDRFFCHSRRGAQYFFDPIFCVRFVVLEDVPVLVAVENMSHEIKAHSV